jgi:hypothetical protein
MTTLFLRDRRSLTLLHVVFTLCLRELLNLLVDALYDNRKFILAKFVKAISDNLTLVLTRRLLPEKPPVEERDSIFPRDASIVPIKDIPRFPLRPIALKLLSNELGPVKLKRQLRVVGCHTPVPYASAATIFSKK